ncbi:S9 family peptidase [Alicyclobacillus cycloheptanicus]|uniref:prolyl oligopeptidase n=1 Tax=Alicyclobacillus cycloheptanicus TaxID=1457 RepID=A0ABT9XK42_9BACL|nr:prolyl oligopeptidase family serine peptidase [Alicyclobacillus cycloheptanicus]MDQ0190676.1 prolyl oligopeptidase [Alicyclobacillus cycloheptanicus]WDM00307.1 S9 family peptidase [Alicyclobacillus cycloheptanicus]
MSISWRKDPIVEDFFGTPVADPYRWLEDPNSPDTQAFVKAQNERTFEYLRSLPTRDKFRDRLKELWNFPRMSAPRRAGERYVFERNDGLQNQAVLYVQDTLDSEPRVLLDPNALSEDGTVELSGRSFSKDGKWMAWSSSRSGSDRQEIRVRNVETGEDGPDLIRWCKFTNCAWTEDGKGFYYKRFPVPGTVAPEDENHFAQVYWHELGTPQEQDVLIYERPDEKEWGFDPLISDDGRYLLLYVTHGTDSRNRLYYRAIDPAQPGLPAAEAPFTEWLDDFDGAYTYIGNHGSVFYLHTTCQADRGRIIAIDLTNPDKSNWREVVPETEGVLDAVRMVHDHLVAVYLQDAHHEAKVWTLDGRLVDTVELPGIGSITELNGRNRDREAFLAFTSFLYPPTVLRYDVASQSTDVWFRPDVNFKTDDYVTKQVFYTSKDGTRVPMFITHRKDLKLDGSHPALLTGYGGFNISRTPAYAIPPLALLEQGGVYALANLRGGGEYGEAWHRAGMFENKQNVFDDFIAAGEWLVDNGYTSQRKLAITGGSNGGLLVAACMLQRPDLYGAVVCRVPVIDMLRYHLFTVGRYWTTEYGNAAENPEHFKFMIRYSPLHNVQEGASYPPVLIMTADTDDRVVPAHPYKFTATLQEKAASRDQVWLRVEENAGHGHGKPVSKSIEEEADVLAFLFDQLGE